MTGFERLGVPATLRRALETMGYAEPTDVQERGLPPMLAGRDVLLEAATGSGKTAAFGVPSVLAGNRGQGLRVLILVPTRELARQVAEEIRAIGAGSPFRAVAVTGGVQAEQEERTLAGDVRCVVATPGRLLALMQERLVRLEKVELVVLDEADRMLDMGFLPDVEKVLAATAHRKQTVVASATLPRDVTELVRLHLKEPVEVRVHKRAIPASLEHYRLNVMKGQKEPAVVALLRKEAPERCIVFTRTRDRASAFAKLLKKAGFEADPLQGDMTHDQRRHVFDLFQKGVTRILVATDLASRGLDVPEMELVVNVDVPDDDESYLHRAGRAGRLGRAGRVVTMVLPDEKERRLEIERAAGVEFTPYRLEFSEADLPKEPEPPAPRKGRAPGAPRTKAESRARAGEPAGKSPARREAEKRAAKGAAKRPAGKPPAKKGPAGRGAERGGTRGKRRT